MADNSNNPWWPHGTFGFTCQRQIIQAEILADKMCKLECGAEATVIGQKPNYNYLHAANLALNALQCLGEK